MVCVLVCDVLNVFMCVVLSGVFVYTCDCDVCMLRMGLCAVCEDCVMLYGVLLEWCLCLRSMCMCALCVSVCVML